MRIIVAATLAAAAGCARAGRVNLPTGLRADFDGFDAFETALRALLATVLATFFTVRRAVLEDRRAVFTECLLIK
ncbi:MAG: hypothetical protein HYX37_09115 [Rhizobiales bacterium]|nr:hypothetical protein [Hyphomicrobiales bacterium]